MPTTTFTANVSKKVTVNGIINTLTVPTLPVGVKMYLNEVEITAGQTINLEDNAVITFAVTPQLGEMTVTYTNLNSIKLNGEQIPQSPYTFTVPTGQNSLEVTGATTIPPVEINGIGLNSFTINGLPHTADDLPYTFIPQGGATNSIYVDGQVSEPQEISIAGTNIEQLTVNGVVQPLPFTTRVSEPLIMAVSGEIFQVDIEALGGTKIFKNGQLITNGDAPFHDVLDVDSNLFIKTDGEHSLIVNGDDIKSITLNGVTVPIVDLPATLLNRKMTANMIVHGFAPSEVHLNGLYMDTVSVDGIPIPITDGALSYEFDTREDNHFINMAGTQPRGYSLSWDDSGSTKLFLNGKKVENGTSTLIYGDSHIEGQAIPIPVHFETQEGVLTQIDGKRYTSNDFIFEVNALTEVDISATACKVTVDYIDGSASFYVIQGIVTLVAPHRDGWFFECWTSSDVGIVSPKSVSTTIDLTTKTTVHLVANYKKCPTYTKPNHFN